MIKLSRADLLPLERYAAERTPFRERAIAHKRARTLHLGPHLTLLFEDRLTVQYQVQEMLRIERIFEPDAIQDELDAYNPLIPGEDELKATVLIEYTDPVERARELERLRGIEHRLYVEVAGYGRAFARADEDLDRSTEHKTSAVHFVRFELGRARADAARHGIVLRFGVDDARYPHAVDAPPALCAALSADLRGESAA
jgi:hypothetical protein